MFLISYQKISIQSTVIEYTDFDGLKKLQEKEKDGIINILINKEIK